MKEICGWQWFDFEEVSSTNDEAIRQSAEMRDGACFVVTARRQTAGRGRRGRSWLGFEGNLFMSLGFPAGVGDFSIYVFVSSLSLFNVIKLLSNDVDVKLELKWPNDVLLNGAKVSGILLEKGAGDYLIAGVGVNVAFSPAAGEMPYATTSLAACGIRITREVLLQKYLAEWNKTVMLWQTKGFGVLRSQWLKNAQGLGKEISVTLGKNVRKGIFKGIDEDGALLLNEDGRVVRIMAGDVWIEKD